MEFIVLAVILGWIFRKPETAEGHYHRVHGEMVWTNIPLHRCETCRPEIYAKYDVLAG